MTALSVSIVGAGISGLVLGRCLLSRGIHAKIFEKSRFASHKNNHGITLHASHYRPLLQVLNLDEPAFQQRVAVDAAVGGAGRLPPPTNSSSDSCFRANRGSFERLLAEGLDIAWECEVDSISLASPASGRRAASLKLKNGQGHLSSVIVGADGPHSLVRSAITGSPDSAGAAAPKVLPFATYNGQRHLTPTEFNTTLSPSLADQSVLEQRIAPDRYLQLSLSDRNHERVVISFTYSRPARRDSDEDALYRPTRSKTAATQIPEELFSEIERLKDQLRGPFCGVFESASMRQDRLLNWLMRSAPQQPLESLEHLREAARGGVVLVGDAVHAEPILEGRGANMAIEDGLRLAEILAADGVVDLMRFYELRVKEWQESVQESERRLAELHGRTQQDLSGHGPSTGYES
ncbi:unnamed protein product [Discula destructiva]